MIFFTQTSSVAAIVLFSICYLEGTAMPASERSANRRNFYLLKHSRNQFDNDRTTQDYINHCSNYDSKKLQFIRDLITGNYKGQVTFRDRVDGSKGSYAEEREFNIVSNTTTQCYIPRSRCGDTLSSSMTEDRIRHMIEFELPRLKSQVSEMIENYTRHTQVSFKCYIFFKSILKNYHLVLFIYLYMHIRHCQR